MRSPRGTALIERHLERIRPVVRHIMRATANGSEAHGDALTPPTTRRSTAKFRRPVQGGGIHQRCGREPLIMTIAASEVWHLDRAVHFLTPGSRSSNCATWIPTSYVDTPDMSSVDLRVGLGMYARLQGLLMV